MKRFFVDIDLTEFASMFKPTPAGQYFRCTKGIPGDAILMNIETRDGYVARLWFVTAESMASEWVDPTFTNHRLAIEEVPA